MADSDPKNESKAALWPEEEYRAWVQSQVASKMLIKLGGITVASLAVGVIWLGNLIQDERQGIVEALRTELSTQVEMFVEDAFRDDLPGQVAFQLIDQSNLVASAQAELRNRWPSTVATLVEEEKFIETASEAIFSALEDRAASQEIIMYEAITTMGDTSSSPATRALSADIFALFHPGVRSVQRETPPLREVFHDVLRAGVEEPGGLPERITYAILEHYPMGPPTTHEEENDDCGSEGHICEEWDSNVIELVLDRMRTIQPSPEEQAKLQAFFRQVPQRLIARTLNWAGYSENAALRETIVAALLNADDVSTRSQAVELLSLALEGDRDSPGFANAAQTLAGLDANSALLRPVRDRVLSRVWDALGDDTANGMFDLQSQDDGDVRRGRLVRDRAARWLLSDFPAQSGVRESLPRRQVYVDDAINHPWVDDLGTALLALLRPGSRDEHSGGVEEWDITFEGTIGRDRRSVAISALAMAVQRDAALGLDVSAVADRLFAAARASSELDDQVLAVAVRHAGSDQFALQVEQDYPKFWRDLGSTNIANDISRALFERLIANGRAGTWLGQQLVASQALGDRYAEHLLRTVSRTIEIRLGSGQFDGPPLERSLRAVQAGLEGDIPDAVSLIEVVLRHALQVSQSQDGYWPVAEAIENLQIFTASNGQESFNTDVLGSLQALYPWIGQPFDEHVASIDLDLSDRPRRLDQGFEDTLGGYWLRLAIPVTTPLRLEGITSGDVVIFDHSRSRVINRYRESHTSRQLFTMLQPGEYAVHWRRRDNSSDRLVASVDPGVLGPTDETLPYAVDPGLYRFLSGPSGGEVWFRVALRGGQTLLVETSSPDTAQIDAGGIEPTSDVDTEIYFFDADGARIDQNDDFGEGLFSRLSHQVTDDQEVLVRINQFRDDVFEPNTVFSFTVLVED